MQGNDFVFQCIGEHFEKRHRQFIRYFIVQHTYLPIPDANIYPNWKLDQFLKHLNQVFMQAVHLPENISCDEQLDSMDHQSTKVELSTKRQVIDFRQIQFVAKVTLFISDPSRLQRNM